jgi:hypothetical protein
LSSDIKYIRGNKILLRWVRVYGLVPWARPALKSENDFWIALNIDTNGSKPKNQKGQKPSKT